MANLLEKLNSSTFKLPFGKDEVEIGDLSSVDFKPTAKFYKWNKEDSLTIKLNETGYSTPVVSDKIGVSRADKDISIYKEEDKLKFVFTLKSKPLKNTYSFNIEGHEEFNFNYQTPLSEEFGEMEEFVNEDGSIWIRPVNYASLEEYSQRPLNVDGSYSVYHKTKKHYEIGKTNYETGKFIHIYVPKATDKNGKTAFTKLHIEDGVYTVTIPQKFLDEAVYPVIINDNVGYTTIGGSEEISAGEKSSGPYTFASNGTLDNIYQAGRSSTGKAYTAGIYDENTDPVAHPENRISDGAEVTQTSANPTVAFTNSAFDNPANANVSTGTNYWIVITFNAIQAISYDSNIGATISATGTDSYVAGTTPAVFTRQSGGGSVSSYSTYVSYTPSGGARTDQFFQIF